MEGFPDSAATASGRNSSRLHSAAARPQGLTSPPGPGSSFGSLRLIRAVSHLLSSVTRSVRLPSPAICSLVSCHWSLIRCASCHLSSGPRPAPVCAPASTEHSVFHCPGGTATSEACLAASSKTKPTPTSNNLAPPHTPREIEAGVHTGLDNCARRFHSNEYITRL